MIKAQQTYGSVVDNDNTTHQNCSLTTEYKILRIKDERIRNKSLLLMKEEKNMSQKEIYLTAEQYVVKCLEDKEQEITKLNEKYDDLLKRFVTLQTENKKFDELKKFFKLEDTSSGNGYQIAVIDEDGGYLGSIAYCWNKQNLSQHFINLLDIVGLELPKQEKDNQ